MIRFAITRSANDPGGVRGPGARAAQQKSAQRLERLIEILLKQELWAVCIQCQFGGKASGLESQSSHSAVVDSVGRKPAVNSGLRRSINGKLHSAVAQMIIAKPKTVCSTGGSMWISLDCVPNKV